MGQQTDEGAAQNWHDCAAARAIDLVHLARQTLGDRSLETEILALFVKQSEGLCARIAGASGEQARRDLAHTLKGSARAVGAWRVAAAAEGMAAATFAGVVDLGERDPHGSYEYRIHLVPAVSAGGGA